MATRNGVGEINDLAKLLDEYQLQVPKKYLKKWEFDTLEDAKAFVKEWEAKGRVFDGHEWRKAVKDENGENVKDAEGNTVYEGVFGEDGKIHIQYCPVGEMVVKCVEKAARMMGSPVHITGAYLTGKNWAECH
ncbi:DNA-directed DNA polymerase [Salmonella phage GEC_vB_MG]|uniref:Uncharacterized protein n=1 Tax=Salmonella phage SSE121 TaxID=1204529 RepID=K4I5G8_9CAUD|nr:DNA polymerase [Salmonella phage SSE121]AFU63710.1 hypothetical protein [Salmonella phage SSE121]QPI14560.1 DNA-directed DNA polymerase [Salmonella phage GEC_vB_MG]